MEHVERQDERENELRGDVEELEDQGDKLEEHGEKLDQKVDAVRGEIQRRKQSSDVPGLQEEDEAAPQPEPEEDD